MFAVAACEEPIDQRFRERLRNYGGDASTKPRRRYPITPESPVERAKRTREQQQLSDLF